MLECPMSRLTPLFSRRVPLYLSLPIIVACGAAGYIANTIQPGRTNTSRPPAHTDQAPAATVQKPPPLGEKPSAVPTPSRYVPSIALPPIEELDLPTPV